MNRSKSLSYVGRILAEVSWEKATKYHDGGVGFGKQGNRGQPQEVDTYTGAAPSQWKK